MTEKNHLWQSILYSKHYYAYLEQSAELLEYLI